MQVKIAHGGAAVFFTSDMVCRNNSCPLESGHVRQGMISAR
jgi:hypothetical protein